MQRSHVTHEAFPAEYDAASEILILGSVPSPKSREQRFYYGHPRNRFWRVLAAVYESPVPESIEEKRAFVRAQHIALWDSLSECDIIGASDSSIQNPVPTDIPLLLKRTKICRIYCTGAAAFKFYEKLSYPKTGIHAIQLPSTSPANCTVSFEELVESYRQLREAASP